VRFRAPPKRLRGLTGLNQSNTTANDDASLEQQQRVLQVRHRDLTLFDLDWTCHQR
jgi:hypothetical protein